MSIHPSPASTSAAPPPMPQSMHRSTHPHALFTGSLAAIALAAALLRRVPPATSNFYPRCLFHQYTGLLCPGCGATRACAALAHGQFAQALHFNALVTLLLPVLLAYALFLYLSALTHPGAAPKPIPIPLVASLLAITALFTLARNLP